MAHYHRYRAVSNLSTENLKCLLDEINSYGWEIVSLTQSPSQTEFPFTIVYDTNPKD